MQPINNKKKDNGVNGGGVGVFFYKYGHSNYESHDRNKTLCMIKRAALV